MNFGAKIRVKINRKISQNQIFQIFRAKIQIIVTTLKYINYNVNFGAKIIFQRRKKNKNFCVHIKSFSISKPIYEFYQDFFWIFEVFQKLLFLFECVKNLFRTLLKYKTLVWRVRQLVIYCDNYVLQDGKLWQVSPPRLARTLKLLFYMQNGRRANNRKKTSYPNRIVVNSFLVKPVTSDCV